MLSATTSTTSTLRNAAPMRMLRPGFNSVCMHGLLRVRQYTTFPMRRVRAGLALLLVLIVAKVAACHDIPFDVTVHAFLRPAGHRLQLVVRAPLAAMRDLDYPGRGPGLLDLSRSEA